MYIRGKTSAKSQGYVLILIRTGKFHFCVTSRCQHQKQTPSHRCQYSKRTVGSSSACMTVPTTPGDLSNTLAPTAKRCLVFWRGNDWITYNYEEGELYITVRFMTKPPFIFNSDPTSS